MLGFLTWASFFPEALVGVGRWFGRCCSSCYSSGMPGRDDSLGLHSWSCVSGAASLDLNPWRCIPGAVFLLLHPCGFCRRKDRVVMAILHTHCGCAAAVWLGM